MGNRALTAALQQIALAMGAGASAPRFHEVILTAPDIDAETFRELAGEILPAARRTTLYASSKDLALDASHRIHGYGRAGDTRPEIVVVPGLDSVDASEVDTSFLGHSYFGDERSVVSDILLMLRNGLGPRDRGLRPRECSAGKFWIFPP
jgi:esterase/lipase superfamily enzyme